jgi:hypothetical protein
MSLLGISFFRGDVGIGSFYLNLRQYMDLNHTLLATW